MENEQVLNQEHSISKLSIQNKEARLDMLDVVITAIFMFLVVFTFIGAVYVVFNKNK